MRVSFLSRVPVAKKLLLLVLLPCLLQAFFVGYLALAMVSAQKELKQVEHQRSALLSLKATAGTAAMALMKIRDTKQASEADVKEELEKLDRAFRSEKGDNAVIDEVNYPELKEIIEDARTMTGEIETLLRQAQENIRRPPEHGKRKLKRNRLVERTLLVSTILNFQSLAKRIVAIEGATKVSDVEKINIIQKNLNFSIFATLALNALITVVSIYLFTKDVASRLKLVADNTHKQTHVGSPLVPCTGSDEIAALDAALQEVARKLEEYRKQELAVLDNAVDVVFTLDEKLKFAAVNNASLSNWGMAPEELLGRSFISILTEEFKETVSEKLDLLTKIPALVPSEDSRIEIAVALSTSDVRNFEALFSKAHNSPSDRAAHLTGVARDITQQKAVEQLKERLLAIVSHDLRTPLASLSITLSVIVEAERISDAALKIKLASIDASIQQLMSLTHDLLALEKQDSELAEIVFETVKAYNVWLQAKQVLQPLCVERDITLTGPTGDVSVVANEEKLVQATNIVANTILKSSANGTKIDFSINSRDETGRIVVRTEDVNPSLGSVQGVIQRFKSIDDENIFDGENISLAIARAIVSRHGGQLTFSHAADHGIEIAIDVPIAAGVGDEE